MRNIAYRVDVLRGNIPYAELVFSSPPTVYMDDGADIKASLRGTFRRNDNINYLSDELRPVMLLNGAEYPLGVYRIATKKETVTAQDAVYDEIEAYDRAVILEWAKLESRDFWAAGTAYTDIISNYLTRAGITRAAVTPSEAVLQSDREDWDIGTPYLNIINTLLAEINYKALYFDLEGNARVEPYAPPSVANIAHTYGAGEGLTLLRPGHTAEIDVFSQPNVFIAILENPEYPEPLVKTAVNDTPSSPLSTVSRGIRIPYVIKVNNIASEADLQDYVNRLRDNSVQLSEVVTVATAAMPNHNAGDTVAISAPAVQGIFREISWSLALEAGAEMTHELQRVVLI